MERMLSKKQAWLKQVRLTKDDDLYVGINARKKSLHLALWLNDAPAIDFVMPPDNAKLIDILNKLRQALRMVVYEAGPTGYSLARASSCRSCFINLPSGAFSITRCILTFFCPIRPFCTAWLSPFALALRTA